MTGRETRFGVGVLFVLTGIGVLVMMLLRATEVTIPLAILDGLIILGGYLLIDGKLASELADLVRAWRNKGDT